MSPYRKPISVGKAAKLLGVSIDTLHNWEIAGKIRPIRTEGGHRRYLYSELKRVYDSRTPAVPDTISYPSYNTYDSRLMALAFTALIASLLTTQIFNGGTGLLSFLYPAFDKDKILDRSPTRSDSVVTEKLNVQESFTDVLSAVGGYYAGDVTIDGNFYTTGSLTSDSYISADSLIISGNKIINSSGKIPGITSQYFSSLDGSSIQNVNAHHLNGIASGDFLRSDESDTAEGAINFTASPSSSDVSGGPIYINPSSTTSDYTLFGAAVGGNSKFRIDAEGDVSLSGNITATGSVGVGTHSPLEKLHISGGNVLIGARPDASGSWSKISQPVAGTVASGGTAEIETVRSSVVYNGSLYVGTQEQNAAEVYRYDGGTTWTRVVAGAGNVDSGGMTGIDSINKMIVYNGKLYIGTNNTNNAELYVYEGGTDWTRVNTTSGQFVSGGTTSINEIESMAVHKGLLYFGTTESNSAEVYRYDGNTFSKVSATTAGTVDSGGTTSIDSIATLYSYDGNLYLGTTESGSAEVYRYESGTDWTKVSQGTAGTIGEAGGANTAIDGVRNMVVYNGSLYIGTQKSGDAEIYRYNGGTSWTALGTGTPGQFETGGEQFDKIHSLTVYKGQMYIGTDDMDDAVIFRYDGGNTWTRITNAEDGTIISGDTSAITEIRTMVVYNDTLIAGTAKSNAAEVYLYTANEGTSYALKFAANSDHVSAQSGFDNYGAITFLAEQQSSSAPGVNQTGQFLFSHGITTATGAYDIAEDFPTRETDLQPGEIIAIDPNESGFVKRATLNDENLVLGIYSTNPALRLSQKESSGADMIPVALAGRVSVKVDVTSSPIYPGDRLSLSATPGLAIKAIDGNTIIGQALETWDCSKVDGPECKETVMVMVEKGSQSFSASTASLPSTDLTAVGDVNLGDTVITGTLNVGALAFDPFSNSIDAIGKLKIQPLALDDIEFLGGKVVFDTKGNVQVSGTLTANKLVLPSSSGTGTIPADSSEYYVNYQQVGSNSVINVSFHNDYAPALRYWTEVEQGKGFKLRFDSPVSGNVNFSWSSIN